MEWSKVNSNSNVGTFNNPEMIEEKIEGMQKKCGEILINENENFNFLCIFCGTLTKDIEAFTKHIKIYHMKLCKQKESLSNNKKSLSQKTNQIASTSTSNSKTSIEFIAFTSTEPSKKRRKSTSPKPRCITNPNNEEIIEFVSFNNTQSPEPATVFNDKLKTEVTKTSNIENLVYYTSIFENIDIIEELEESQNDSTIEEENENAEEQKAVTVDDIEIQKLELEVQQMLEDDKNKGLQIRTQNKKKKTPNTTDRKKTVRKGNVSCNICHKKFNSEVILNSHLRYDHTPVHPLFQEEQLSGKLTESDPLKCRYCGKKYTSRRIRYQHECSHTGEKPFECHVCHKSFGRITTLNSHLQIHENKKPYKCEFCPLAFNERSNLNVHMRRHKNEKNFKCRFCDKAFVSTSDRNIHERVHTGERPFQCTECGLCVISSSALKSHFKTRHAIKKPHECQYCEKSFLVIGQKLEHERIHTGEKPFVCEVCSVSFHRKKSYIRHGKLHLK